MEITEAGVTGRLDDLSGLNDLLALLPEIDPARAAFLNHIEDLLNKSKKFPSIRNYARNKHYMSTRMAAVSGATARSVAGNLWNPHTTSRIQLWEWWCFSTTAAASNPGLARTTARGTASTSLAAAIGNSIENDTAAPAGVALDTAWSVAPTVSAATMGQVSLAAAAGNGIIIPLPDPPSISPLSGAAIITVAAVAIPISDLTFVFGD